MNKTTDHTFDVAREYSFEDGSVPDRIETRLINELREAYLQPTEYFPGSTECFYDVDQESLFIRINELIEEYQ